MVRRTAVIIIALACATHLAHGQVVRDTVYAETMALAAALTVSDQSSEAILQKYTPLAWLDGFH